MMVPEEESAFAFYAKPSSKQKRRKKIKEKQSSNKLEKLDIIRKKKEKKEAIMNINKNVDEITIKNEKKNLEKWCYEPKKKIKKNKFLPHTKATHSDEYSEKSDLDIDQNLMAGPVPGPSSKQPSDADRRRAPLGKKKTKMLVTTTLSAVKRKNGRNITLQTSTPLFKQKSVVFRGMDNSSKSSVLHKVDSYIVKKENQCLPSQSKDKKRSILSKLAEEAKRTSENQGSIKSFGEATLQKILKPVVVKTFLRDNWEKKPIHIPGKENKFKSFISTEMIDAVLRENIVLFGDHLDVTTFTDGQKEVHNPEGRAHAHIVWDYYSNGCSVRLLNPQFFMNSVHLLNSHLQEFFGCFVGSNAYLTPPNSQGYAPHYDDIEAFILQVEGSKIWKIYPPIDKNGWLPRYSSRNLSDEEIGEPLMEVRLEAGDVLYFPRGFIHQGRTEDKHSLHITLSTYQRTSWADFLEKVLPLTLKKAASQNVEFRKGMPLGYLQTSGYAYQNPNQKRKVIVDNLKELLRKMADFLEVDTAMDEMGMKLMQEALPPVLTPGEAACSVLGGGLRMEGEGKVSHQIDFSPDTRVRWIRYYCFRIMEKEVLENGLIEKQIRIYYTLENSREYCKVEPQYIIIPQEMVPAVTHLVSAYPEYTKISDLPGSDDDEKVSLVGDLWDRGLLMTDKILQSDGGNDVQKKGGLLSVEEAEVFEDLLEAVPEADHANESLLEAVPEEEPANESCGDIEAGENGRYQEETELVTSDNEGNTQHDDFESDDSSSS